MGVSVRHPDATAPGASPDPSKRIDGDPDAPAMVADALRTFTDAGYPEVMVWLEPMDVGSLEHLAASVALLRSEREAPWSGSGQTGVGTGDPASGSGRHRHGDGLGGGVDLGDADTQELADLRHHDHQQ